MPSRLAIAAALAALVLGAALPARADEPRSSRPRVSADGIHTVRLLEHAPGRCTLEVFTESGAGWKLEQCVGGVDDMYFVSNDGRRVWVLKPLVQKGKRRLSKSRAPVWAHTAAAALYDREAGQVRELRLAELLSGRELTEAQHLKNYLKWLEGTLGVPGRTPRLTDDQHVEFEPIGGKTRRLAFY